MLHYGLGYRRALKSGLVQHQDSIDCLEIITEQFIPLTPSRRRELKNLRQFFKLIPHGLNLSVGSVEKPKQEYLDNIARILEIIEAKYYSDHFAVTQTSDYELGHLSPIWCTEEVLEVVINNVNQVQRFLQLPLVLETITQPFCLPRQTMSQEQFISEVCRATGCGILLDVTNIFINSVNLGGEAKEFVKGLPTQAVRQLHLVGYKKDYSGFLIDGHSDPVQPELWELYDYVMSICSPEFVIIERDANFPDISELLLEVKRTREIGIKVSR